MYIVLYNIIFLCTYYICCVKITIHCALLSDLILILLAPIKRIRSYCKTVTYTKFITVYTLAVLLTMYTWVLNFCKIGQHATVQFLFLKCFII